MTIKAISNSELNDVLEVEIEEMRRQASVVDNFMKQSFLHQYLIDCLLLIKNDDIVDDVSGTFQSRVQHGYGMKQLLEDASFDLSDYTEGNYFPVLATFCGYYDAETATFQGLCLRFFPDPTNIPSIGYYELSRKHRGSKAPDITIDDLMMALQHNNLNRRLYEAYIEKYGAETFYPEQTYDF